MEFSLFLERIEGEMKIWEFIKTNISIIVTTITLYSYTISFIEASSKKF